MNKTIIFIDLDATIMVNPFNSAIFPTIAKNISSQVDMRSDLIIQQIKEENAKRLKAPPAYRPAAMDWDDIIDTVARRYNVVLDTNAEKLISDFLFEPYIKTLDNAESVLRVLAAPHRKLVVSSMGLSKYQVPVMKALGIYHLFDDYLMPDLTGYLKTDGDFYNKYRNNSNAICISIGDHYIDDIICPKMLGFYTVLKAPYAEIIQIPLHERLQHISSLQGRVLGLTFSTNIIPDAIIGNLDEFIGIIEYLEEHAKPLTDSVG